MLRVAISIRPGIRHMGVCLQGSDMPESKGVASTQNHSLHALLRCVRALWPSVCALVSTSHALLAHLRQNSTKNLRFIEQEDGRLQKWDTALRLVLSHRHLRAYEPALQLLQPCCRRSWTGEVNPARPRQVDDNGVNAPLPFGSIGACLLPSL
jgi:hypothetical protein